MAKTQPRAVRCIETGDVYQSSGAAGRAFNIDPSGILKCCKGLANSALLDILGNLQTKMLQMKML